MRKSYSIVMNKKTPSKKSFYLEAVLQGDLNGTVEEILKTCKTIAKAKEDLEEDDYKDIRERFGKGDKVWSKLLQVGLDDRLEQYKEVLPPKYTTLHQIHTLNDEELTAAIKDGVIHTQISQGVLTRWLKEWRFQGSLNDIPENYTSMVSVLAPKKVPSEKFDRFKSDLEKLVINYGFKTQYDADQTMQSLRQQKAKDKSNEMYGSLIKDLKSTWESSDDDLKRYFSLTSLDDLINVQMSSFTGFLFKVRGGKEEFWKYHGVDYINKTALEYLKSNNRGQRFNYRRRLREVSAKHPQLANKITEVLEKWMKY